MVRFSCIIHAGASAATRSMASRVMRVGFWASFKNSAMTVAVSAFLPRSPISKI